MLPNTLTNNVSTRQNVQCYYFNWALDNVLTVFTALTQVDFLIASMLGSSVVTLSTTCYYFREKEKYKKDLILIGNDDF